MSTYCRDAYHAQRAPEHEAGLETIGGNRAPEWLIPLRWGTILIGGLSLMGLGIGLTLQWLLG